MAERFAILFLDAPVPERIAAGAIVSTLFDSWCLHFSTSWPEKQYWQVDWLGLWDLHLSQAQTRELEEYLRTPITPQKYGRLSAPDVRLIQ
jgi:hypothetical protein